MNPRLYLKPTLLAAAKWAFCLTCWGSDVAENESPQIRQNLLFRQLCDYSCWIPSACAEPLVLGVAN
ncbi:hypothetical protein [Aeoliella mucimassa]|uniref:hypothetical protein n=1 Tax=Aeoliella mucimassa TaxID=2527972 RepID=UPI00119CFA37|nr:hypothetical protein [Aeoliella mucimassa]